MRVVASFVRATTFAVEDPLIECRVDRRDVTNRVLRHQLQLTKTDKFDTVIIQ